MKKLLLLIVLLLLVSVAGYYLFSDKKQSSSPLSKTIPTSQTSPTSQTDAPAVSVLAKNLDTPWAIAFLPDGALLVTERKGTLRMVDKDGNLNPSPIATITDVLEISEGGLLGVTIHPDFLTNKYLYLYYTYESQGTETRNRVVRYKLTEDNQIIEATTIVDAIPGAPNHNGGRIKFGPDRLLYITTGDAQEPSLAQNRDSLAGKILRVNDDGSTPRENPFDTRIYTYGHRNPQGITWDDRGQFFETEHGQSARDEVNKLERGKNYGWPDIRGDQTKSGMVTPLLESGNDTWAPGDIAYHDGKFFFVGLRGQALYVVDRDNPSNGARAVFKNEYGRLREIIIGPDNMLYITTSNRDGRGVPTNEDDRIFRINPSKL